MTHPIKALLIGSISTLLGPSSALADPDREWVLPSDSIDLLAQVRREGLALAFVSDLPPTTVRRHLRAMEPVLSEMDFGVITSADLGLRPKPSPDVYRHAVGQLRLTPRDCVALEETETAARASLRAGIRTMVQRRNPAGFHGAVALQLGQRLPLPIS